MDKIPPSSSQVAVSDEAESEIETIPLGWEVVRIADKFTFTKKPRGLQISQFTAIPFVPMDLIPFGKLYFHEYILKRPDEISSGTYFEPNDILVPKITPSFENGKQGMVPTLPTPFGYATTEVIPIAEQPGISSREFLYYYLLKDDVRESLAAKMEGSTGRQRLRKDLLEDLCIPFPPLLEQRAIAHVLSRIQAAAQAQATVADRARELKRALMAKLFTEGLQGEPLKETEIGPVPESWEVRKLGDYLTQAQYGLSVRGEKAGQYPILRMTNQQNGEIIGTSLQYVNISNADLVRFKVNRGDLLFNRTNSIDLVGRTALFDLEGDFVFASYLIRLALADGLLEPRFVNEYLNHDLTQARLKGLATRGVSQSNISASRLKTFVVPIPPLDEQQEMASILQGVGARIAEASRKQAGLEELFRAMLRELMTGRVRATISTSLVGQGL